VHNKYWVVCLYPEAKGFYSGAKVHLTQCMDCEMFSCKMKILPFQIYFQQSVSLTKSPINKRLLELNSKLTKRKYGSSRLYCPKKENLSLKCGGLTKFCKYNVLCNKFIKKEGKNFIKSIRWRRQMIYIVKFYDGTMAQVDKRELGEINIDNVEIVYPGNLSVEIVTELVPQGTEMDRLEETVAAFKDKYRGDVVTTEGVFDFGEWFEDSKTGDSAIVPEKALVPVKSYKVVKIKQKKDEKVKKSVATNNNETAESKKSVVEVSEETKPQQPEKEKTEKQQKQLEDKVTEKKSPKVKKGKTTTAKSKKTNSKK